MTTIKRNAIRKWSTIGMAAMISLGTLAAVTPAHASSTSVPAVSTTVHPVTATPPVRAAAAAAKENGPAYIKSILALAKQGKVPKSSFVSGKTTIKEVHKVWGEPTLSGGGYETFNFGMGQGAYAVGISSKTGVIYDLRDFGQSIDPSMGIKSMTFTAVAAALGKPKEIKFIGNDKIYLYAAGSHQLKFVGPKSAPAGKTAHIDHINVYTPAANK
ncbi:YjgB family protein [Paenibacillus sp. R14(2021)]|uniref:YjgB family protein n=1 Tax=Paenibacillus sp. R14(2021) TaxID=2859228 RepID=UPI001C611683|nr:YjgB family protein [Paenibacillus sp. R14(2021)]